MGCSVKKSWLGPNQHDTVIKSTCEILNLKEIYHVIKLMQKEHKVQNVREQ